ncbi:type II secretion system protein F [Zobellella denitrificans]|jgi:type IV pilus assembly protein PilC|uniref:Type II secretion system protein F n=1 Tax=Zobellella denitrificans TaxID=347534 RepID=A0A231MUV0_9GAMM|nr:type II secretion system F family protein [Zobellella denitrificans]ATG75175.1 type II secretion system protein F [Zobellella denitrificans]OXS13840.1 type II secretion system protein F [Zobellella denitrificans]
MATAKNYKVHPYKWEGVNRRGQKVSGFIQAVNIQAVKRELQRQGVNATSVRRRSQSILARYRDAIKPMDIAVITRQIATMLGAGVPLVQTLQIISRSYQKSSIRELTGIIASDVEGGTPLSEALKKFPRQFDALYCDLVHSGEQTGALEHIFDQIAIYREKAEALKSKIKKAMFYPAMVILVAIAVTSILLLFVIPQFEEIFAGFGATLPAFTQLVINLSRWMQDTWLYLLAGLVATVFLYVRAWRLSQKVRDATDRFILRIPVVGMILHKAALARFARTLATTFSAGIPLVEGLVSSAGASGNVVYRRAIMQMRNEVIAGMQMNLAMRSTQLFPDMVVQMVMIGEESGAIDDMMNKVASIYEREVDDAVDGLTSLIEPIIMVVLGILVGGLVIAMYLPIFNLGSVIR